MLFPSGRCVTATIVAPGWGSVGGRKERPDRAGQHRGLDVIEEYLSLPRRWESKLGGPPYLPAGVAWPTRPAPDGYVRSTDHGGETPPWTRCASPSA